MAKIVSKKLWVKVSRKELETFLATQFKPGNLPEEFELIDAKQCNDNHRTGNVTFCLSDQTGHLSKRQA